MNIVRKEIFAYQNFVFCLFFWAGLFLSIVGWLLYGQEYDSCNDSHLSLPEVRH